MNEHHDELRVEGYTLGPWETNCYLLWTRGSRRCWVVDAGFDPAPLIEAIEGHDLEPEMLILTHAHVDHIAGIEAVREVWPDLPILIHEEEEQFLSEPELNLSIALGEPVIAPPPTDLLEHGQRLALNSVSFEVRHTPGHSPGGVTLYQAEHQTALVGDTLFEGAIGRIDFPTSDGPTLLRSIHEQLLTLPDATRIYPGHMGPTNIGRERRHNPFLTSPV